MFCEKVLFETCAVKLTPPTKAPTYTAPPYEYCMATIPLGDWRAVHALNVESRTVNEDAENAEASKSIAHPCTRVWQLLTVTSSNRKVESVTLLVVETKKPFESGAAKFELTIEQFLTVNTMRAMFPYDVASSPATLKEVSLRMLVC